MRYSFLLYLCFILLSQAASDTAAAADAPEQSLEDQLQIIATKVLSELDDVKESFDSETKAAIQKALKEVAEQGSKALPEGHKLTEKDILTPSPAQALTADDDTEKNIADTNQDLNELEDDFKEQSRQIREKITELIQQVGEEAELLQEEGDEVVARAKEVASEGDSEVNGNVVGDLYQHIAKHINDFYSSASTEAPAKTDDSAASKDAAAPAADAPAAAEPAPAADAPAAAAAADAPAADTPETEAAPAAAVEVEAAVAASAGSSGSIMSALFIICSVISAAGFTLYCIGNQKQKVLTYSHKETELDRLFQGQSYYQSRENRRHFY